MGKTVARGSEEIQVCNQAMVDKYMLQVEDGCMRALVEKQKDELKNSYDLTVRIQCSKNDVKFFEDAFGEENAYFQVQFLELRDAMSESFAEAQWNLVELNIETKEASKYVTKSKLKKMKLKKGRPYLEVKVQLRAL